MGMIESGNHNQYSYMFIYQMDISLDLDDWKW